MALLTTTIKAGGGSLSVPGYPSSVVTASSGVSVDGNALTANVPLTLDGGDAYLTFSTSADVSVTVTYTAPAVAPLPASIQTPADKRYGMASRTSKRWLLNACLQWQIGRQNFGNGFSRSTTGSSTFVSTHASILKGKIHRAAYGMMLQYEGVNLNQNPWGETPNPGRYRISASIEYPVGSATRYPCKSAAGALFVDVLRFGSARLMCDGILFAADGDEFKLHQKVELIADWRQSASAGVTIASGNLTDTGADYNAVARTLGRASLAGMWVGVTSGNQKGQCRLITSHTATVLTIETSANGNADWSVNGGLVAGTYALYTDRPTSIFPYWVTTGNGESAVHDPTDGDSHLYGNTAIAGGTNVSGSMAPVAICSLAPSPGSGQPVPFAPLVLGDSHTNAAGAIDDGTYPTSCGWLVKALYGNGGFPATVMTGYLLSQVLSTGQTVAATGGTGVATNVMGGQMRLGILRELCNACILEMNYNDANTAVASDSAAARFANWKANFLNLAGIARACDAVPIVCTEPPRMVTTDGFTTLANQTPASAVTSAAHALINDYIISGQAAADVPGLIVADLLSLLCVKDSGVWKWRPFQIVDPASSMAGVTAASGTASFVDSAGAFVSTGVLPGDNVYILTGPSAGKSLQVKSVTNATTLVLDANGGGWDATLSTTGTYIVTRGGSGDRLTSTATSMDHFSQYIHNVYSAYFSTTVMPQALAAIA